MLDLLSIYWPQTIYLFLVMIGLIMSLVSHGESRADENFFITLIAACLSLWLVYMGGFFN